VTGKRPAYYALRIEVPEDAAELVQAILDASSPLGLELRDATLEAPPGAAPLPPGKIQVVAYFEGQDTAHDAFCDLQAELPQMTGEVGEVERENWAETWKAHVKATRVGRIWVGPSWERERAGDAEVAIVIDPGMAFGTGDHPTTSMCLAELDSLLRRRPGAAVLDVGTGSGILAIAARKLGAGRVVGTDIDPVALEAARENATRNRADGLSLVDLPLERVEGSFDIVVANLFANILGQLAPRLCARLAPDGVLLLTGLLLPQATEVLAAFEREGARPRERRVCGEWVLLSLEVRT
jgi:ribosomal protein L11 methyltransferase